ncbi:hypothetical protein PDG61_16630 [Mycolicibacterium sp. BiH015]|uniref:hypothetical protein n=1 Tax=Mycolicibacterium sp. BiH015 TaxID=3018808 RepID=UPI0022E26D12|nr:hypothetical protein [Mycolicibacterium sp. BiH015]MDA2892549.1 hypothetical protein [Mycolicibacterium sp. BiH015]
MTVVHLVKLAAVNALIGGAALAAATQAGAQPAVPFDPPPPPPAAAPAQPQTPVFQYIPIAEGAASGSPGAAPSGPVAPPAPPPAGAPYIPPVPNANFGNTGQFDFLRDLWNMRNNPEFMQTVGPGQMDPATWVPPTPYGDPATAPPPPAPGSPPVPASAPPPIWPPVPVPAPAP